MIHFIVADITCKRAKSIGIYPYKKLRFTRCHPDDAERAQIGLQGMTGNLVPIFSVTDWEVQVNKLLMGK